MWIFPWKLCRHSYCMWDKLGYDSIYSGNFSLKGYLVLIQKDSVTQMHGFAVYVKEDFLLHKTYF